MSETETVTLHFGFIIAGTKRERILAHADIEGVREAALADRTLGDDGHTALTRALAAVLARPGVEVVLSDPPENAVRKRGPNKPKEPPLVAVVQPRARKSAHAEAA